MVQHGQCLCGAVKITIKENQDKQVACHFVAKGLDCQKLSGAPYTSNVIVSDDLVDLEGKTKSFSSKADSGHMVEHLFCPECGSTIANRSPSYAGNTCFKTGLFGDDFKNVPFGAEIYIKDRFEALKPLDAAQEQAMPSS